MPAMHSDRLFSRQKREKGVSGYFPLLRQGISIFLGCCLLLLLCPQRALAETGEWITMPAGARSAYIGINGGTVPVSLLTSRDGSTMITLVGKTGNDFLQTLGRAASGSFLHNRDLPSAQGAILLQAHTAAGTVPVIYVAGSDFSRMDLSEEEWLPYGLSATALRMEGRPAKPLRVSKARKYRHIFLSGTVIPSVVAGR